MFAFTIDDTVRLHQAAETVWEELGPYHSEKTYQNALALELKPDRVTSENTLPIYYKNQYVGFHRIDLYWKTYILEIKTVRALGRKEMGQAERYARTCKRPTALVNFSPTGIEVKCVSYT